MNGEERQRISKIVEAAIDQLLERDSELLILDVNERSVTHKLAEYLQQGFPDWNVDCEYNRNHDNPKTLAVQAEGVSTDDTQARTVFPDIIVHERNTGDNFLVIEVKKSTNGRRDAFDLLKLRGFKEQLGYRHAIFLKLRTGVAPPGVEVYRWVEG